MTPTIRTTYLALSKTGRVIQAFQNSELGHAFVAKRAEQGVMVELVEETTIRKPCPKRRGSASVSNLDERRRVG